MSLVGCAANGGEATVVRSTVVDALARGSDDGYARPTIPIEFEFPADHGPHPDYRTEWWYYTGNLADEAGNPYGYQLTFFRSALAPDAAPRESNLAADQIYLAHFAVTDGAGGEHYAFDRFSRGANGLAGASGEPRYAVWLEDWAVEETEPGIQHLRASADEPGAGLISVELTLRETRDPILHGDRGLSQKGTEEGNANYYYSLVGLETSGAVTVGDESVDVTGLSWMDHEFGTSALSGDARGWDWFSVQLDNGAIFMFGEFHDGSGGNRFVYESTLILPGGQRIALADEDFELSALGEWVSPNTGIVYPFGWQADFPALDIQLQIRPIIEDQEMDLGFVYYEGATSIEGTMAGEIVRGRGYVELTGYGDSLDEYQR